MSTRVYEAVTEAILEALKKGVVPWRKPWHVHHNAPCNAVSKRVYRGINVFLLGLQPFTDHRWLTFRQAQELGGSVRRGEKSTFVVFWKQWDVPSDPDSQDPVRRIPLLKRYFVFNAEQCEGLKLEALPSPAEIPQHERIARADLCVANMPNPPTIKEGGSAAWYQPASDLVQVPPLQHFTGPDAYYATLFHELSHSTGHEKRLNRAGVTGQIQFGSDRYSREELVAELASAFCCATIGLDNSLTDASASYLGSWLEGLRDDPKAMVVAAGQAQRAADYIFGIRRAEAP